MCALLIGQGAILLTLGILGEYLWRTFDESRRRPRFIIDQLIRTTAPNALAASAATCGQKLEQTP
jgi:hypothetical protein